MEKEDSSGCKQGGGGIDTVLLLFATLKLLVMGIGSCRSCWENAFLHKNWPEVCWFVLPGYLTLSLSRLLGSCMQSSAKELWM